MKTMKTELILGARQAQRRGSSQWSRHSVSFIPYSERWLDAAFNASVAALVIVTITQ